MFSHTEAERVDLLMLNLSNYPSYPVYPYAFVQVSALARRRGLNVKRLDLLNLSATEGTALAQRYIKQMQPRMIGFTLRQADSTEGHRYIDREDAISSRDPWFPVEDTKYAIDQLRQVTDTPIVMGGFTFSVDPIASCNYFQPDFGVWGEPDSFLDHFEDLLAGRGLDQINNLIYRPAQGAHHSSYVSTKRVFYPPLDDTEYNGPILDEIVRFHGFSTFYQKQAEAIPDFGRSEHNKTVAIEISRGCPFQCAFCTDPHVKGRSLRLRSLDVIEAEIRFLLRHGVRYFWFVCSELNLNRNHTLALAERIIKINEEGQALPIYWRSYFLPTKFTKDDMRILLRSGLLVEQNGYFSVLDDENLAAMKEPYRTRHAIAATKDLLELEKEPEFAVRPAPDRRVLWSFIANPLVTPKAIADTVRILNEERLSTEYTHALAYAALRVYASQTTLLDHVLDRSITVYRDGLTHEPDLLHPTFYYPQALIEHFGNIPALLKFLDYLHHTFMSTYYRVTRDWLWFTTHHLTAQRLLSLVAGLDANFDQKHGVPWCDHPARGKRNGLAQIELVRTLLKAPTLKRITYLLNPIGVDQGGDFLQPAEREQSEGTLALLFYLLYQQRSRPLLDEILAYLGIPLDADGLPIPIPYELMRNFYAKYASNDDLIADIQQEFRLANESLELLLCHYLFYQFNVNLQPRYVDLLFGSFS